MNNNLVLYHIGVMLLLVSCQKIIQLKNLYVLSVNQSNNLAFHIPKINLSTKSFFPHPTDISYQHTVLKRNTKVAPPKKKKPPQEIKRRLTYRKPKAVKKTADPIKRQAATSTKPDKKKAKKEPKTPHWKEVLNEDVEPAQLGPLSPDVHEDFLNGDRPRLTVTKTNNHLYASLVDDARCHTLCFAGTSCPDMDDLLPKTKRKRGDHPRNNGDTVKSAWELGKLIGKKILSKGITKVRYDKAGYKYHGKVLAIAEGARAVGLDF